MPNSPIKCYRSGQTTCRLPKSDSLIDGVNFVAPLLGVQVVPTGFDREELTYSRYE